MMASSRSMGSRLVGSALLATTLSAGLGGVAGGEPAPPAVPVHLGPVYVNQGEQAVLALTNLTRSVQQPVVRLIDQTGATLQQARPMLAPGANAFVITGGSGDADLYVRAMVGANGDAAERMPMSLSVLDGPGGGTRLVMAGAIPHNQLPDGTAATAPIRLVPGDVLTGLVTNLAQKAVSVTYGFGDGSISEVKTVGPGETALVTAIFEDPDDDPFTVHTLMVVGDRGAPILATSTLQEADGVIRGVLRHELGHALGF